jgi:hypothetical protein
MPQRALVSRLGPGGFQRRPRGSAVGYGSGVFAPLPPPEVQLDPLRTGTKSGTKFSLLQRWHREIEGRFARHRSPTHARWCSPLLLSWRLPRDIRCRRPAAEARPFQGRSAGSNPAGGIYGIPANWQNRVAYPETREGPEGVKSGQIGPRLTLATLPVWYGNPRTARRNPSSNATMARIRAPE